MARTVGLACGTLLIGFLLQCSRAASGDELEIESRPFVPSQLHAPHGMLRGQGQPQPDRRSLAATGKVKCTVRLYPKVNYQGKAVASSIGPLAASTTKQQCVGTDYSVAQGALALNNKVASFQLQCNCTSMGKKAACRSYLNNNFLLYGMDTYSESMSSWGPSFYVSFSGPITPVPNLKCTDISTGLASCSFSYAAVTKLPSIVFDNTTMQLVVKAVDFSKKISGHVLCLGPSAPAGVGNPSPLPSPSPSPSSPVGETPGGSCPDAQAILDMHNAKRALHNAQALTWSSALAATATKWAQYLADLPTSNGMCQLYHSARDDPTYRTPNAGENLAVTWGGVTRPASTPACTPSVYKENWMNWYDEYCLYKWTSTPWADNLPNFARTGHFTQVVWKDTSQLGCGTAVGTSYPYCVVVACQYLNAGNYIGDSSYLANLEDRSQDGFDKSAYCTPVLKWLTPTGK